MLVVTHRGARSGGKIPGCGSSSVVSCVCSARWVQCWHFGTEEKRAGGVSPPLHVGGDSPGGEERRKDSWMWFVPQLHVGCDSPGGLRPPLFEEMKIEEVKPVFIRRAFFALFRYQLLWDFSSLAAQRRQEFRLPLPLPYRYFVPDRKRGHRAFH